MFTDYSSIGSNHSIVHIWRVLLRHGIVTCKKSSFCFQLATWAYFVIICNWSLICGFQIKRSDAVIRGPYNANARSSYVELVLVLDNKEYKALGENMGRVNSHCKDIANIINAVSGDVVYRIQWFSPDAYFRFLCVV